MFGRSESALVVAAVAVMVALAAAPVVVAPSTSAPDDGSLGGIDIDCEAEPPSVPDESTATVGDRTFDSASAALDAAEPGDTVVLEGRFDERLAITDRHVSVVAGPGGAVVDGGGEGDVVVVEAENVTLDGLWIRNSGYEAGNEDAGVVIDGNGTVARNLYLTEITYGVWVDGVNDVTIADNRIEGRGDVYPLTERGNGIHLWETENATVRGNDITTVRDGIYYSWAEHVLAANNSMWDSRYGVHYMYSNDNRLVDNVAVDNDVGYALMVSNRLEIVDNVAARNDGTSGHGIMVKEIEDSEIRGNVLAENGNGLYVYNAQDNAIVGNLVLRNDVGVHHSAASEGQRVVANSFIDNDASVLTTANELVVWNGTRGNYWSDARTIDRTNDGISEVRHRPAGIVEQVVVRNPQAAVFAESPAFDAVRLAENSFPVVETPGIVDRRPLTEPPHDGWRTYTNANQS